MKETAREQKRVQQRLNKTQGYEINQVFNKLVTEFNPILLSKMRANAKTGQLDVDETLNDDIMRFNKRWHVWATNYSKNKQRVLKLKLSAFTDYVEEHMDNLAEKNKENWIKNVRDIVTLNSIPTLEFNPEMKLGNDYISSAYEILEEQFFTSFKYNKWLVIKNWVRKLFKYSPDYPVISFT